MEGVSSFEAGFIRSTQLKIVDSGRVVWHTVTWSSFPDSRPIGDSFLDTAMASWRDGK